MGYPQRTLDAIVAALSGAVAAAAITTLIAVTGTFTTLNVYGTSNLKDVNATGTVAIVGTLSQGEASSTNYVYFGTADGCGAMVFAASGTTPTLTPTSTSFCN
ncbi:MAG: hypothetical protein ACOYUZ_01650 [Patescibacteria group bacterium]